MILDLIAIVKESGIVGAGGAGFPTHAKLTGKAEYILLNGAECEPLLRVDQQLMREFPGEVLAGLAAAGNQVEAQKAIIGIKNKHKTVIRILKEKIMEMQLCDYVEVMGMEDVYPAGDEQVLVYELTKQVVPEASIPLKVGCVVINVETALNIYRATAGVPVVETYLTVAGDIENPITVKVPIGSPVSEVLQACGVKNLDSYRVINGGPMMGPVIETPATPSDLRSDPLGFVTKTSKGFVLLKKDHSLIRRKTISPDRAKIIARTACEQCRMCTDLCPRYLLGHNMQPHKMMRMVSYNLDNPLEEQIALLCCECNICELFACPVNLPPRSINVIYKNKLAERGVRYQVQKEQFEARSARDYRLVPSKRLVMKLGLKEFDKEAPLTELMYQPEMVSISLKQHIGVAAEPLVRPGDRVAKGQMIGKIPEGSLGAAVHASIDGFVTEVGTNIVVKVG